MPLPKPRRYEDENDFIQRCSIHPQVVADFDNNDQRVAVCYDLYDRKENKQISDRWKVDFRKQLYIGENVEVIKVRRYYREQYRKAIEYALTNNDTNPQPDIFKFSEIEKLYVSIYQNIGLRFAKWYSKNISGMILKQQDVSGYDDVWSETFAALGKKVYDQRRGLVQGTAKKTLQKTLKKLFADPDFQKAGTEKKAMILNTRFNKISRYQAQRIVRTEATNAANKATIRSATDIYGKNNVVKEWISIIGDGRTRENHVAIDGAIVGIDEKFQVGGDLMANPADPSASAANVVNCRCAIAVYPKE